MKKNYLLLALATLASIILIAPSVMAARPAAGGGDSTTTSKLGIDVSWPQCGKTLPTNAAFTIIGVNGGLATTTNPCLKDQLIWGNKTVPTTPHDKLQLYVNTANPGGMNTASWPKDNSGSASLGVDNPYLSCNGSDSLACAWQYGWNRALEADRDRFQPAALQSKVSAVAADYIWWLDVETENTWKEGGTQFDYQSNVAVLEGMTAYFNSVKAKKVGLYSTGQQWGQIVGNAVSDTSNLNGLDNWRPGGASQKTAQQACTATPLTTGGKVVMTQFISKNLDYNHSCI